MPKVVGVHGIAQQLKGPAQLAAQWYPALSDGVRLADRSLQPEDLAIAFYGNLFRKPGRMSGDWPPFTIGDITSPDEIELLELMWRDAARTEPVVPGPDDATMVKTPVTVQRALNALSRSRFFAGLAQHVMIGVVKQVHLYFTDDDVRETAISSVEEVVDSDTRVVIGHSLGSVVAYEAIARHPEWQVHSLVTVGSPLGIRNIVFDRLAPSPQHGRGSWPGTINAWVNVASPGDVVALVKSLADSFDGPVHDLLVDNESKAHDIAPYLSSAEVGRAVTEGFE
jgi:hypothetical protein